MIMYNKLISKLNKNFNAFSLAELLIALLIISIVLTAAIPVITKKSVSFRDNIWNWSDQNDNIFAASGTNQSAILGINRIPSVKWTDILDSEVYLSSDPNDDGGWAMRDAKRITYSNDGNKFVILKKQASPGDSDFKNSHIAFYNSLPDGNISYSGRLTMDPGNIALGIGSLQTQRPTFDNETVAGENTAIGHFALLSNIVGVRNTAIGKKTLSNNSKGSYNTAAGFGALFSFESNSYDVYNSSEPNFNSKNTAIGALSQRYNISGIENTSIGFSSLLKNTLGNYNTAIGNMALSNLSDNIDDTSSSPSFGNTAIGYAACNTLSKGDGNICIGHGAGADMLVAEGSDNYVDNNFGLYIGVKNTSDNNVIPEPSIITGHMLKEENKDKELFINAKRVGFRPFNGSNNVFEFLSFSGEDGYTPAPAGRFGVANFNLRDTGSGITTGASASNRLSFLAPNEDKTVYIQAYDPYNNNDSDPAKYNDINFNYALTLDFPDFNGNDDDPATIDIRGEIPSNNIKNNFYNSQIADSQKYPIIFNNMLEIAPVKQSELNNHLPTSGTTEQKRWVPIVIDSENSKIETNVFSLLNDNFNLNLNKDGHQLSFSNGSSGTEAGFTLSVPEKVVMNTNNIELKGKNGEINFGDGDISISPNGIELNKDDSYIKLKKTGSDISIEGIYDGMSVKEALNDLNSRILMVEHAEAVGCEPWGENDDDWGDDEEEEDEDDCEEGDWGCDDEGFTGADSDLRLKNILGDNTAGLKEITALEIKNYTFKNDRRKTPRVGVIAQQLQKIFPNAVSEDKNGYLKIRTEDIFFAMVNSIKELFYKIQNLTTKITGLDKRITELKKQNKKLIKEQDKQLKKQNKKLEKRLVKLEKKLEKKQLNNNNKLVTH